MHALQNISLVHIRRLHRFGFFSSDTLKQNVSNTGAVPASRLPPMLELSGLGRGSGAVQWQWHQQAGRSTEAGRKNQKRLFRTQDHENVLQPEMQNDSHNVFFTCSSCSKDGQKPAQHFWRLRQKEKGKQITEMQSERSTTGATQSSTLLAWFLKNYPDACENHWFFCLQDGMFAVTPVR